jgi:hypothetical protein
MVWPFSKKSSDGDEDRSSDPFDRAPRGDDLLDEQIRQHKREQIKRDGFDFDEELRRMAEDDDR